MVLKPSSSFRGKRILSRLPLLLGGLVFLSESFAGAQKPIVHTSYTPDPAPYAYGDKLYMFTGHDEDDATYFLMKDYQVFCTSDMANWTYLGTQMSTGTFPWAQQGDNAWASQAVCVDGKWFWYVCLIEEKTGGNALAVATAPSPQGPWKDALGGPLAVGWSFIDPTVFIDDDGSAYLFWGNKGLWYGKLAPDMTSFMDGWKEVPGFHDPQCFGPESMKMDWSIRKEVMMVGYEEGPWLYKKDGTYYLSYPSGGVPEHMAYSTAPTIDGPWTYRGKIMDTATRSFTIHGGNVNFRGHDYMFYHDGTLPNGGGFHRSACVEEFSFSPDGSIPFIPFTKDGPAPLGSLNPYERVEAETMASCWGLKTDRKDGKDHYVTSVHNGDWIRLREVELGEEGPGMVTLQVLNFQNPGRVEFYLDNIGGAPLAKVEVTAENPLRTAFIKTKATGRHDLYILFRGADKELFDLDWWKFTGKVNMPLIQTKYTADPAPLVYDGKVFLYTTHDEDWGDNFEMYDWLLYTSEDMVNWTDHGAVASTKDFKWRSRDNGAWALQVIERNGKFYMYCPLHGHGIGVLVSDSPYGPFKDPLGEPLVWQREHWFDIDPSVMIDEDGQAYLYWGNPHTYWALLGEDMISLEGPIHRVEPAIPDYQEGPWIYRHDGRYYLAFASTCCPEGIGYAMSESPVGPWEYKGHIMDHTPRTRGNHPGIIDYKGRSYVFGLNYDLMHLDTFRHHERRSVSAAEMTYRPDGTIEEVPYWQDAPLSQIEPFKLSGRIEAETMSWGYGLKTEKVPGRGIVVCNIDDGEYLKVSGVDFERGKNRFSAEIACGPAPARIEVRLDSEDGPLAGTLSITPTPDGNWKKYTCSLEGASSVHDLYFVFRGEALHDLMKWDCWTMK